MSRNHGIVAFSMLAIVTACGGSATFDPSGRGSSTRIVNGVPTGSSFGNVGAVMFDFNSDGLDADDWFCTGSLIAPTVFLTAAHCLEFLPANAQVYVTFAPSAAEGVATAIAATSFHFDPLYGHDSANPHDIGVVILPSNRTRGITPLRLPAAGYLDAAAAKNGLQDAKFINVGYGGDIPTTGQPLITYDGVRKSSISCASRSLRTAAKTVNPAAERRRAQALPIPEDAPVTSTAPWGFAVLMRTRRSSPGNVTASGPVSSCALRAEERIR